jgi:DNA polymerase III alpha subunit (gram-positive type)
VQSLLTKPTDGQVGTAVFDLETNGLSFTNEDPRIHCIAIHWAEDKRTEVFNDEKYTESAKELPMGSNYSITTALSNLEVADVIVGHNIIGFDLPYIHHLYPWFNPRGTIIDTLLLSRLYHPNLLDIDKKNAWKNMPTKLYGRHSLEAYGYRLGVYKGDFAKDTDWKEWSQEMQDYCIQDVKVTEKLCDHFHPYLTGLN